MKKINLIIITFALLVFTSSCKKFVEGYDKDPNGLRETNAEQAMQGVLLQNQFFNHSDGLRLAMMMMNQATGTDRQYVAFNDWNNIANKQMNSPWSEVYSVLSEALVLEKEADKIGNQPVKGLAELYRAWAGGMAASLWGDVPFSEAGNYDVNKTPKYDSQADVFNQVQSLLDQAIVDLQGSVGNIYNEKDIYFEGDVSKWVKIAHGLKARFYLNAKDYANAKAEAAMGPASADDDMIAPYDVYPGSYGKYNPMFQFDVYNREGYIGVGDPECYSVTLMQARDNNDETSRLYFNYIPDAGILNSYPGYWWLGHDGKYSGPQALLTYGEMQLIQIEAEARLNGVSAALPLYNDYRNMLQAGYAPQLGTFDWGATYPPFAIADFQNGGSQNPDNISELDAFLREIMEERYLYFIGDLEAFVDHARANGEPYANYMQLKSGFNGNPVRFIYPQSEVDANPNVPKPVPTVNDPLPMYN